MKINQINLILSAIVIILSFYTIVWHHQNYQLYKQANAVQNQYQKIMALHQQLSSEYSQKMSGFEIKQKAIKTLHLRPPSAEQYKEIKL